MTDPFQIAVGWALLLIGIAGGISVGVVAGRRYGIPTAIGAATNWSVGYASVGMGSAHLAAILWSAVRGSYFYNFRLAALLLVGFWLILGGSLCVSALSPLRRRRPPDWGRAIRGTLLLLLVAAPLVPVQPELAGGIVVSGAVNLAVILRMLGGRRIVRDRSAARSTVGS